MSQAAASNNNHADAHAAHEAHEGPIKTPKQLIFAVIAGFAVPIALAIMLANFVAAGKRPSAGADNSMDEQAVAQRIKPVGHVDIKDASSPAALKNGEQVFNAQCAACHATGAAGAPKLGDAAAWAPRIKTGFDALMTSALKGKGAMAAQGGGDHSDFEIARAIVFMANKAGATFAEPKAPAAAASAAASAPK